MEFGKEKMELIHYMYWKEINLLKINLDILMKDSERFQKMLNELTSVKKTANIFGIIVFDRYMTHMVTALNMARKYNIHLEVNNLENTVTNSSPIGFTDDSNFMQARILKDFFEWREIREHFDIDNKSEINAFGRRIKMTKHVIETNPEKLFDVSNSKMKSLELKRNDNKTQYKTDINTVLNKIYNLLIILLPVRSLAEFKSGYEFEAYVLHVRDYEKLEFYICLNDDYKTLINLSTNINFETISRNLLPPDDVFCVLDKNEINAREFILRALIVPEEYQECQKLLYLLDFGEIIPLTDKFKTFKAPLRYKQIPPLAIKCILDGIEDSLFECIKDKDKCKNALLKNEFQKANFRVVCQKDRVLHVLFLENSRINEKPALHQNNTGSNTFVNCKDIESDSSNSDVLKLSKSVIYNASKTIDSLLNIPLEVCRLEVMVTHIVSPTSFYGIIQNNYWSDYTFSWHDRQLIPSQRQISSAPHLNDIVLSQYYKDGYWYRAKIINADLEKNFYTVFYVDFGNTDVVALSCLAKCSNEQLKGPFRAVLFHLANLSIASNEQNVRSSEKTHLATAIENLVVMILDQIITFEVVEHRKDDIVVRFTDSEYENIPKMLIDTGVVKEI